MRPNHNKKYNLIVLLFFVTYLCVGIGIFKDYGLSTDEGSARRNGILALDFIMGNDQTLRYAEEYHGHGPAFRLILAYIERVLNLKDSRVIYLMRHFVTFLIFYIGVYFFYRLCKYRFGSWKIALLGSLFLVLSPRVFAHSFYNPKDIPFLVIFIISMYTLVRFLDEKTLLRAATHALMSAFLVAIRIAGMLVPLLTILFILIDLFMLKKTRQRTMNILASLMLYLSLLIPLIILFWPALWGDPINNFLNLFHQSSSYQWWHRVLYMGRDLGGTEIPWHYIPVWIIISTPISYVLCFFIGLCLSIVYLLRNPVNFYLQKRSDLIFITWFILPLVFVVQRTAAGNTVVYNAWRHMFFVYPAFLLLAITGLMALFGFIKRRFVGDWYRIISRIFIFILAFDIVSTASFMIKYHPHQNLYFNKIVGGIKGAYKKFDLDYWGLSYRDGLEYILQNDKSDVIECHTFFGVGFLNHKILPIEDRQRLVRVKKIDRAKYLLTSFRGGTPLRWYIGKEYPFEKYYSVKIDGMEIHAVYKLY